MNSKLIYIPICILVVSSVIMLALEMSWFNQMFGFLNIVYWSIIWALILMTSIYFKYRKEVDGENLYTMVGSSLLFGFVVVLAYSSYFNRVYATKACTYTSYNILDYEGRYASGNGTAGKKPVANQWILSILKDGEKQDLVFKKNLFLNKPVTSTIDLQFCKGMLDTEYLNME